MKFLSICITSYNRVSELKRCLESVDCVKYADNIEIVVSEDKSPKKDEIQKVVLQYKHVSKYAVVYNSNEINLGYDGNLGKLIQLATGKYILFMSDDDAFIVGALNKTIETLMNENYAVAFSPFHLTSKDEYRRIYTKSFSIEPTEANVCKYQGNSILFSGLIFQRDLIDSLDSTKFKNLNYFQVYLFLNTLFHYGGGYINIPLLDCIGDGANGFGLSDSSVKNECLADRESLYSQLEFHKGLIKTISIFDRENQTDVKSLFAKEYSLKSYPGLSRARAVSMNAFNEYWRRMNALDIKLGTLAKIYYFLLWSLGSTICNGLMKIPRVIVMKFRSIV